jgi:hypothetical protein
MIDFELVAHVRITHTINTFLAEPQMHNISRVLADVLGIIEIVQINMVHLEIVKHAAHILDTAGAHVEVTVHINPKVDGLDDPLNEVDLLWGLKHGLRCWCGNVGHLRGLDASAFDSNKIGLLKACVVTDVAKDGSARVLDAWTRSLTILIVHNKWGGAHGFGGFVEIDSNFKFPAFLKNARKVWK